MSLTPQNAAALSAPPRAPAPKSRLEADRRQRPPPVGPASAAESGRVAKAARRARSRPWRRRHRRAWAATTPWRNSSCSNSPRFWAAKLRESDHYQRGPHPRRRHLRAARRARAKSPAGSTPRFSSRSTPTPWPATATGVQGATVYTVSDRASDAEAARVAEHENKADSAAGVEAKEDASDVNDILFDLTRRETRAYSHVFARSLAEYWKVAARLNKNPQPLRRLRRAQGARRALRAARTRLSVQRRPTPPT